MRISFRNIFIHGSCWNFVTAKYIWLPKSDSFTWDLSLTELCRDSNLRPFRGLSCGADDRRSCTLSGPFRGRQAGVARGRLNATAHARRWTHHVFQHLVANERCKGMNADPWAVLAVRRARYCIQQACHTWNIDHCFLKCQELLGKY